MFESAGMENPKLGTVIVGILKIVFTIVTIFIMNRFRRKVLLQLSLGIDAAKIAKSYGARRFKTWLFHII